MCRELIAWYTDWYTTKNSNRFPLAFSKNIAFGNKGNGTLLVARALGEVWIFNQSPKPVKLHPQSYAIGSGAVIAMEALRSGKTAKEAVELASKYDKCCGDGVDVLEIKWKTI